MKNRDRNRNRKLGTILALTLVFLLWLVSCATNKSKFFLPSFEPVRPNRPILLEVEDGSQLPVSVKENTVLLTCYIEELEAYADGWEAYYQEIRKSSGTKVEKD